MVYNMSLTVREKIEKFLPPILSKKVIYLAKVARHTKNDFLLKLDELWVPSSVRRERQNLERKLRNEKRASYNNGLPFIKEIDVLGVPFKIVLDPVKNGLVDEEIAERGCWEKELSELYIRYIPHGGTFVDIGANIGYHSLFVAALLKNSGRVYSFEPIPRLCDQLTESIRLNAFSNIQVFNFGLAEKDGEAVINLADENTGGSSLLTISHVDKVQATEKIILKKLDLFLDKNVKIDAIKIDVEGYEFEALKGAEEILRENRPIIFMEFSPMFYIQESNEKPYALISFLENLGYSFFTIKDTSIDLREWLKEVYNINTQIEVVCKVI